MPSGDCSLIMSGTKGGGGGRDVEKCWQLLTKAGRGVSGIKIYSVSLIRQTSLGEGGDCNTGKILLADRWF